MARPPFGVDDPTVLEALRAYVKLLRATRAVVARVEPRLTEQGLTTTQLGVLEAILHHGPITQREIAGKVLTSAGNLTDVIDKLSSRGLVRRSRETADRRTVRVALTEPGRGLIEELFPRHAEDIARAMAGLTPEELSRLGALLRKLGMAGPTEPDGLAATTRPPHLRRNRSIPND